MEVVVPNKNNIYKSLNMLILVMISRMSLKQTTEQSRRMGSRLTTAHKGQKASELERLEVNFK